MTHVTCKLTAKNRDQLRNPALGNRLHVTITFFILITNSSHRNRNTVAAASAAAAAAAEAAGVMSHSSPVCPVNPPTPC